MKTLNTCAVTFFVIVFALALIGTFDLLEATIFAVAVSVPLYLMGCVFVGFVRCLVRQPMGKPSVLLECAASQQQPTFKFIKTRQQCFRA